MNHQCEHQTDSATCQICCNETSPQDTPTPRTDELRAKWRGNETELCRALIKNSNELERELTEAKREAEGAGGLSNLLCNIQDTCRIRGFLQRPVDEAVIAMAQSRDAYKAVAERLAEALESRTPRTDAEVMFDHHGCPVVLASFARTLERELAKATAREEHYRKSNQTMGEKYLAYKAAADRLAVCLRVWCVSGPASVHQLDTEALAAYNELNNPAEPTKE